MTNIAHARRAIGALIAGAPLAGMVAYLLTVALTQTDLTVQDWVIYVATGAAVAALAGVAAWLGVRSHDPRRIATTGLAVAVLGAVTFPVFWLGVIQIFGVTAAAMALTSVPSPHGGPAWPPQL
jgi:hypothetical protein